LWFYVWSLTWQWSFTSTLKPHFEVCTDHCNFLLGFLNFLFLLPAEIVKQLLLWIVLLVAGLLSLYGSSSNARGFLTWLCDILISRGDIVIDDVVQIQVIGARLLS
jgi:hypothetical protein